MSKNKKINLNGYDLYEEILIFEILHHFKYLLTEIKKSNAFPNLNIFELPMLTILLTSAGTERTFSKLKLI